MTSLSQVLQGMPLVFVALSGIIGLLVGSFSSDVTRKRVSLH